MGLSKVSKIFNNPFPPGMNFESLSYVLSLLPLGALVNRRPYSDCLPCRSGKGCREPVNLVNSVPDILSETTPREFYESIDKDP